jgi:hypothetical protein
MSWKKEKGRKEVIRKVPLCEEREEEVKKNLLFLPSRYGSGIRG